MMHAGQQTGTYDELKAERDRIISSLNKLLGNGHYYLSAILEPRGDKWVLTMVLE